MKKILYCASTISHIKNFHIPYLKAFHDSGYEVWVLANKKESVLYSDHVVALPFEKNFISLINIKSIFAIRKLIKEQKFDIVSTHTTLASAIVRAGIMLIGRKPEVFNTCHGYLFSEKNGLKKWLYLLPEKICASVTNNIMVMNHEDYEIATKYKLYKDNLYYISGMGIDLEKFTPATQEEKSSIRKKRGISEDDFLFVYAAEFSKRKNQIFLIRSFAEVCQKDSRMKLLLAGKGALLEECKQLVCQLHVEEQILFLGFVSNMRELYAACDVCVSSSQIEGLPFNIMEAMACGLPVVASNIKGHRELVSDGETGMLYKSQDSMELQKKIMLMYENKVVWGNVQEKCREQLRPYELQSTIKQIMNYYMENKEK